MSLAREMSQLIRQYERQGYRAVLGRRSCHWKIYDGNRLVAVTGSTPNDARAIANTKAAVRRYERSRP